MHGGPREDLESAYPVASGAIKMTTFGLNTLSSSSTFPLEMVQVTSAPRDILVTVTFIRHPEAEIESKSDNRREHTLIITRGLFKS